MNALPGNGNGGPSMSPPLRPKAPQRTEGLTVLFASQALVCTGNMERVTWI